MVHDDIYWIYDEDTEFYGVTEDYNKTDDDE